MSELSKEEYKELMRECIKEVLVETHQEFQIDPEIHYQEHLMLRGCATRQEEMRLNHDFVTAVRQNAGSAKRIALITAIGSVLSFFIGWVIYHFQHGHTFGN